MSELSNSERETHLNLVADDRGKWHVYSDDPVMIRRLDKISVAVKITPTGKYYELEKGQVSLRKNRVLTDDQRTELRKRMQSLHRRGNSGVLEAQNGQEGNA